MKVIFQHKSGRKQSMQRRYADILKKLNRGTYMTRDMQAAKQRDDDELSRLRAEYQDFVGKRPFHGWDADMIRQKIAESGQVDD